MDFFRSILTPHKFPFASNFFGGTPNNSTSTTKTTSKSSTKSASSTYQDPWSDDVDESSSLHGSSDSNNKPADISPTSDSKSEKKKRRADGDNGIATKDKKHKATHTSTGEDASANKSDHRKVKNDRKQLALVDSADEIILLRITSPVQPKRNPLDLALDFKSSRIDNRTSAGKLGKRKWAGSASALGYHSSSSAPVHSELVDDTPSKKRKTEGEMAGSLFDEVRSPGNRRVVRSPPTAGTTPATPGFSFNTPPRTPPSTTTQHVDTPTSTPSTTPSQIRLRPATNLKQQAVLNRLAARAASGTPPKSTTAVDSPKPAPATPATTTTPPKPAPISIKTSTPPLPILKSKSQKTSTPPSRESRRHRRHHLRPKNQTWSDISLVDDKGLLDTFSNRSDRKNQNAQAAALSTGTPRKGGLSRCTWVKIREPVLEVLMPSSPGDEGKGGKEGKVVPRLILTDTEGRCWRLEEGRSRSQVEGGGKLPGLRVSGRD
ncbi:hypothetical protein B0T20DRAFT_482155 [Sordaria brevicollis]|uniref:Uncharacterized protein n=1 Tax=Sordaria brevicollis TaxID=83679 RepID=A0AAE0P9H7_SORBR|nr:hypothetical protein B0T20DRAFT_482155 [Sordaria brevicollis]